MLGKMDVMKIVIMVHVSVDIERKKSQEPGLTLMCIATHGSLLDVRL